MAFDFETPGQRGAYARMQREFNRAMAFFEASIRRPSLLETAPSATPPHEAPSVHPPPAHTEPPPGSHEAASDPEGATPAPPSSQSAPGPGVSKSAG